MGIAVDQMVGTCCAHNRQFIRPARHPDHGGPQRLADFHCRQADTARGPQHKQRLAALQARAVGQRQMRGAVGHIKPRRDVIRHGVGHRQAGRGLKNPALRQPARPAKDRNTGANGRRCDTFTLCQNGAADLHAQHKGWGGRVLIGALGHQQIGEIQATCVNVQQNLSR